MGRCMPDDLVGYLINYLPPKDFVVASQINYLIHHRAKHRLLILNQRQQLFNHLQGHFKTDVCQGQIYLGPCLGNVRCQAKKCTDSIYCGVCNHFLNRSV